MSEVQAAQCRVCGQLLGVEPVACASCQTPAHADCFAYAGGCSIFGCGSIRAVAGGRLPDGWRVDGGAWLIPASSVTVPGAGRTLDRALTDCFQHWRTCGAMELFSLAGQAWFSLVAVAATAAGIWPLPHSLLPAAGLVLVGHLNAMLATARVGWILSSDPDPDGDDAPVRAARIRQAAIRRSTRVFGAALVAAAVGLAVAVWPRTLGHVWMLVCVVAFPWFSLVPRWRLEEPLLAAVESRRAERKPLIAAG